ncbi:MAG TPA: ArsR family transcriptional regulator [Patescibacteria group bacterium]|nr:ArsR family transcriptional regulator [Patescibacteria group bacterium]
MLDSLITSKTRIKLLLKFFSNTETKGYLRGLADEFGESTNAVRVELNRLTQAGLLKMESDGRTKLYRANYQHSLFPELNSVVKKYLGIDKLIETIILQLGNIEFALITGDYAKGIDSGIIDLVIVGEIDHAFFQNLVSKAEGIIKRKIRPLILNSTELKSLQKQLDIEKSLILWANGREYVQSVY